MEKTFDPAQVEARIAAQWEAAGAFKAGRPTRAGAKPYTIVIPPPNVTGNLHMGHALNNTLQDILCRFERMRGRDVLWQPGLDHAGIATQMVVENQLMERQQPDRRAMGREAFVERIWQWKDESGGAIVNQLKRLGASCDWSRERFTMGRRSDGEAGQMQRAVMKVFVQLYRDKLIYKDKRLVNWDPKFQSAISDIEVLQVEKRGSFKWARGDEAPFDAAKLGKVLDRDASGHLYYFDYPLEGSVYNAADPATFIQVATTRPETILGDTAVAVHPDNERLKHLIGRNAVLPLIGRGIPVIGDDYADPEKGTGAVKITPAHDFNDFEVGKRHKLRQINVLDAEANMLIQGNEAFAEGLPPSDGLVALQHLHGLRRDIARKQIVEMMEAAGFLAKIEPTAHTVPHGDRSGVVIEPWLTDQWYVDAKTMAQPALRAVHEGKTNFIPKNWEKTYFEWLDNIQPWCVSRQLWWGHQIPAWYGPDGQVFVAESEAEAYALAQNHYATPSPRSLRGEGGTRSVTDEGQHESVQHGLASIASPLTPALSPQDGERGQIRLTRDPDVLDTWFSSALWPFSTLGWPDQTAELKRYYPTNTLVTGFDIIFFWVARMMMMGTHFMGEVPFKDVYIHALVRDASGAKMSKSKGNVIDPLGLIDTYGADALRFTLAAMAAQGRDIKMSTQRVEGYRNFATKLWNAARFAEMNECKRDSRFNPKTLNEVLNRWIISETAKASAEVTASIEGYRFNEAANAAYRFVWGVFCDWYVELSKPLVQGPDGPAKDETRAATAWVLDEILKILHPFMPFLTEELWAATGLRLPSLPVELREAGAGLLALADWPQLAGLENREAEEEIGWVVDLVNEIRSLRVEMNVPGAAVIPLVLVGASPEVAARAKHWGDIVKRLARLSDISLAVQAPASSAQILARGTVAALALAGIIDLGAEKARLLKEISKLQDEVKKIDAKLGNADFIKRAPEEVVEEQQERREEALGRIAKMQGAAKRLGT